MNKKIQETKQKILDALEGKEEKEFIVDFGSVIVMAKDEVEAEKEGLRMIKEGEIEIDIIEEN